MDAGEKVFEEVAGGSVRVRRGEADSGEHGVRPLGVVVLGDHLLGLVELFAEGRRVGEHAVRDLHGVAHQPGDGVVGRDTVLEELQDEGGRLVGECLDVVRLPDHLGRRVVGDYRDGFGGGVQPVGGGDLDGGGAFAAEEHGLLCPSGEVPELGALHGGQLCRRFGVDRLGQLWDVQGGQGPADVVCVLQHGAVGDHHRAALGKVRRGHRCGGPIECLAFLLPPPALAVHFQ